MFFFGLIDEVRIWNIARSEEEIAATMSPPLSDKSEGLLAYWRFEGEGESVVDATGNGNDGKLMEDAKRVAMNLPSHLSKPAVLVGVVRDEAGSTLSGVDVSLLSDDETFVRTQTDADGHYRIVI